MSEYIHGGHIRGSVTHVDDHDYMGRPYRHWVIEVRSGHNHVLADNGYATQARAMQECSALVWAARMAWAYGFGGKAVRGS